MKETTIPFGASDSELMEATYFIPQGYHAVIDGDKVIIKKGEDPVSENTQFAQMADKYEQQVLIGEYQMKESIANHCRLSYYLGLKDGALWQKERDQSTIELAEDHAMLAGMEKMKQEIIDKAMVWLTSNMKWGVVSWDDKEECVRDFKDAMLLS